MALFVAESSLARRRAEQTKKIWADLVAVAFSDGMTRLTAGFENILALRGTACGMAACRASCERERDCKNRSNVFHQYLLN